MYLFFFTDLRREHYFDNRKRFFFFLALFSKPQLYRHERKQKNWNEISFYDLKVENTTAYSVQISLFVDDHDPLESGFDFLEQLVPSVQSLKTVSFPGSLFVSSTGTKKTGGTWVLDLP